MKSKIDVFAVALITIIVVPLVALVFAVATADEKAEASKLEGAEALQCSVFRGNDYVSDSYKIIGSKVYLPINKGTYVTFNAEQCNRTVLPE